MPARPLVITARPQVLDDLLRVAATAGVELDVADSPATAAGRWSAAPIVVVGADQVRACARRRLPRRAAVMLLGDDLDDAGIWERAVQIGAERVVFLPDAEAWLREALAEAVEPVAAAGVVLGVVGGRGGAGATTLSAALGVTAARRGLRTLLVDGDPLGGGIDLVFGGEDAGGLRWPDLGATRGRLPGSALVDALPRLAGMSVLSWDRGPTESVAAEAVEAVLAAGRRSADVVVVDLPRSVDDGFRTVASLSDLLLLVVPAEVRAAAAAARVATRAAVLCRDLRVVVREPAPSGLRADAVAGALHLPLAGRLRPEPHLDADLERGEPPGRRHGPLASLCARLLDEVLPAVGAAA